MFLVGDPPDQQLSSEQTRHAVFIWAHGKAGYIREFMTQLRELVVKPFSPAELSYDEVETLCSLATTDLILVAWAKAEKVIQQSK